MGVPFPRTRSFVTALRVLLVLRLAGLLALLGGVYFFRSAAIDLLESIFGLGFMNSVVYVFSTLSARLILYCGAFALFAIFGFCALRYAPRRYCSLVFACLAAVAVAFVLWRLRSLKAALGVGVLTWCLVAANALSRTGWNAVMAHPILGPLINGGFWAGVGVEALLPRPFLIWSEQVAHRPFKTDPPTANGSRVLPAAALAAGALALFMPYPLLMTLGQTLFMSPQAKIVFGPHYDFWSEYDVSDIARNPKTGDLFLCGDNQDSPKLLRKNAKAAIDIGVSNAGNQFCEFWNERQLFMTVNDDTKDLQLIDPADFHLVGGLHFDRMPPGEIFLASYPKENLLAVASEDAGGVGGGPAIRVVDLDRLKVVREIDAEVGYIIADPSRPVIYINHFAMDVGVRAYDMRTGELLAHSVKFGRSDRMKFDAKRDEVLATAPSSGEIWRFDAKTLEAKPPIKTVFGARGLAIDPERDLLLVSSFLTNEVDVIDLKTGRSLRRYRLGPWLRDIDVVSGEGVAYVASRYGLYRLDYLD